MRSQSAFIRLPKAVKRAKDQQPSARTTRAQGSTHLECPCPFTTGKVLSICQANFESAPSCGEKHLQLLTGRDVDAHHLASIAT